MSIEFKAIGNELILAYEPEMILPDAVREKIEQDENWNIAHCFFVGKELLRNIEDDFGDTLYFCVGAIGEEYTLIDSDVTGTDHNFYFSNDIRLHKKYFVAYQNISILRKIDRVVNRDVYIGGNAAWNGGIPFENFKFLLDKFPKSSELVHYANARISSILKEFYPTTEQYERKFQDYLTRQDAALSYGLSRYPKSPFEANINVELDQFSKLRSSLFDMLSTSTGVSETIWQEQIHGLLRLLYPKYIAGIREVVIKGVDRHEKRPDFLLIDASGYVDILEIKKPDVQILTKQSSYRNNYVPMRELAGAVQQIEKYIYCLNAWGADGESILNKQLVGKLPDKLALKVVNPQGILLLGRSKDFNRQQRDDFELIRRQYKHIAEIMTYDDLIIRIDNIISALYKEIKQE